MWYYLYDLARDLAAERERDASRERLAHAARRSTSWGPTAAHSGFRHAAARALRGFGRSATGLARTLDGDADRTVGSKAHVS